MTQAIKSAFNKSKLFVVAVLILTMLQLFFDTLNVSHFSNDTKTTIGAAGIFLALLLSGLKDVADRFIYVLKNTITW